MKVLDKCYETESQFLKGRGLPTAICTRNNMQPVEYLIKNFLPEHTFDPVGFY